MSMNRALVDTFSQCVYVMHMFCEQAKRVFRKQVVEVDLLDLPVKASVPARATIKKNLEGLGYGE